MSKCLLSNWDILFIDEIHRLHPAIEEYLYPAMEDFRLDIIIDQGPNARSITPTRAIIRMVPGRPWNTLEMQVITASTCLLYTSRCV